MSEHRWGHHTTFSKVRGQYKVTCTCGWQSKRSPDFEKLVAEAKRHTGLVEREKR